MAQVPPGALRSGGGQQAVGSLDLNYQAAGRPGQGEGAAPTVGVILLPGPCPVPSRFELVIVWRIHVDMEGKVLPQLDLLPGVPRQGRLPGASQPSRPPGTPSLCAHSGRQEVGRILLMCFLYQLSKSDQ